MVYYNRMAGSELADRKCVPCHGGTPTVPEDEAKRLLAELDGWTIEDGKLARTFKFKDFLSAIDFVNRITPIAEEEGHHPDLEVGWGRVKVLLITHAIKGLSDNDFILAAKIDRLNRG